MPNLDPNYQLLFPLQEVIFNKTTGLPLANGIVTFYSDSNRSVLKDVYQLSGSPSAGYVYTSLGSQLTLSSIGSFVDNTGGNLIPYLWLFDGTPTATTNTTDLYYITVYAANPPIGDGSLQFTQGAWPGPNNNAAASTTSLGELNQAMNPQFVQSFLAGTTATTISVTGGNTVTAIAPDWNLVTTGTGTITIQQKPITATAVPGNAPFSLSFSAWTGSISQALLQQPITQSPNILAGNFVNGSMVVSSANSVPLSFTMNLISPAALSTLIVTGSSTASSSYTTIQKSVQLPAAVSSSAGDSTLSITLPVNTLFEITSIQLIEVPSVTTEPAFIQQSTPIQLNNLFHYYQYELITRPKQSILVGWNFPLNPWQFTTTAATTFAGTGAYIADQTILSCQNASSLQTLRTSTAAFGVKSVSGQAQGQWAITQYIDTMTIAPYWSNILSSLVRANITTTTGTLFQFKLRLLYRSDSPTQVDPISAWNAVGTDPAYAAGWTAIKPLNDPIYTLSSAISADFSFDSFQMPAVPGAQGMIAIILISNSLLNSTATTDTISFDRISLVPNRFAVDSPPQTFDEVFSQCEFYYERSYELGIATGTTTTSGAIIAPQQASVNGGNYAVYACPFSLTFRNLKRTPTPLVTFYSTGGAQDNVKILAANVDGNNSADQAITSWGTSTLSSKNINLINSTNASILNTTTVNANGLRGWIQYHYTCGARLGITAEN